MSKTNSTLTAERLRELLHYNPETGVFTRRLEWYGRKPGSVVGTKNGNGRLRCSIDGDGYYLHRLAWLYVHGVWPPEEIDHINRIPDDNRLANLRPATRPENGANRGRQSNNSSGFTGVAWNKKLGKWESYIYHVNKRHMLGRFDDPADASAAYVSAARGMRPEFIPL
jgi:hypothetical protein